MALLANNLGEIHLSEGFRSLFLSIVGTTCLLIVFYLFFRNWYKAGLLSTFVIILISSYGQIYRIFEKVNVVGVILGRHRILLPIYAGIAILGIWWIVKRVKKPEGMSAVLNIIGIISLAIPVIRITAYQINTLQLSQDEPKTVSDDRLNTARGTEQPDVYYIVLDAYARGDALLEFYGFDNSDFLNQLEALGFFVADCSQSNYAKTRLSLASTLNMNYLGAFDSIAQDLERGKESRIRMGQLIQKNEIRKIFDDMGYTLVAFQTGYLWSEWEDADIFFSRYSDSTLTNTKLFSGVTDFESLLFSTSIGLALMDAETVLSPQIEQNIITTPRRSHYDDVLYTLDLLGEIPGIEGPKFTFAHMISPHGPYVFDAAGNFNPDENNNKIGYIDQILYLNKRLISMMTKIIEESEIPPIIILQADHGGHGTQFDPDYRMKILNAYYLPDGGDQFLYETISPVNTFRVIMDTYFNTDFGLLEDLSYYSSIEGMFDFEIVKDTCSMK